MKTRLLAMALIAVIVGLGSCSGKKKKSSEAKITAVSVDGQPYTLKGNTFEWVYPKLGANDWGLPQWDVKADITWVGKSIFPDPDKAQNFENGNGVTYTVTAEDGNTNTYTIKATRELRDWP